MGLFGKEIKAAGQGIKEAFSGLDSFVDNAFTNKEEKLQKLNELEQIKANINNAVNNALTERHKADMNSDSWLSKNIRPLTLAYLLLLFTAMIILDATVERFSVPSPYISLLGVLLTSVFTFYFVGREITKNLFKKFPERND